jgi:hypothetical protein
MPSNSGTIQDQVKQKLGIKWVHARDLTNQAIAALHIDSNDRSIIEERNNDIIDEACELFADLSPAEQEKMKIPADDSNQSDFKKKAMATAAKREQEWADQVEKERLAAEEVQRQKELQERKDRGEIGEDGLPPEEFHITRTITKSGITVVNKKAKPIGGWEVQRTKVLCSIM